MSEILLSSVFSGWETYSWESLNNIPQITQTYNGANSCIGGSSLFSYKYIIPYCTVFMLRSIRQDRRKLSGKWIRCYCRNYNCFNLEDCMFLNIQTMSLPQFSSVACHVRLFATPWSAAGQAFLSITNSQSLPKLMSIDSMMPSNRLILCRPLLLLPSIFPSIRVFPNESAIHIRCLYLKW